MPASNPINSDITIITTCKPFRGQDSIYQKNALLSWIHNGFSVAIVGKDDGVEAFCKKNHCLHLPEVETSKTNIPYISSIFEIAETHIHTPYYVYSNSDILLDNSALPKLRNFLRLSKFENFLLTARRRNIPLSETINYTQEDWSEHLRTVDANQGTWDQPYAIDFFFMNKGWLKNIPPLLVGRAGWDNWMLHNAQKHMISIIDASDYIRLYHPVHYYNILNDTALDVRMNPESLENKKNIGKIQGSIETSSTHQYNENGVLPITEQSRPTFSVDIEKQFRTEIELLKFIADMDCEQIINRLYVILARSLRFFPCMYNMPSSKISEFPAALVTISDLCSKGLPTEGIDLLQDWLLESFLTKLQSIERGMYIWGAGEAGKRLLSFLQRHQIHILGFIDNRATEEKEVVIDNVHYNCILPSNLSAMEKKPYVLLASMYHEEMITYLTDKGFSQEKDYSY